MVSKRLTAIVAPCNEAGHVNACTGSSLALLRRGHRVIFVIHESWRGHASALGFEEVIYTLPDPTNPAEKVAKMLVQFKIIGQESPKEKLKNYVRYESENYEKKIPTLNSAIKSAIDQFAPDVILIDDHLAVPAVIYSGIPWIKSLSMGPLFEVFHEELPPGASGLSINGDRSEWSEFNQIRRQLVTSVKFNNLVEKLGYPRYENDLKYPPTELLTIYACPEELNFPQVRAQNWFNLEAFHKRSPNPKFKLGEIVPDTFLNNTLNGKYSGKLIFFSMGSLGSIDLDLVRRLIGVFGQTKHKYIVSKGPHADQYELPENMFGARYLPQTSIVPLVELVITHGGNNSFTETFALGKPMIVLPLFLDQYDNARRLQDTGFGLQLDPYNFKDEQLIQAIEQLINDETLAERLKMVSQRIQSTDTHQQLALKIEQLLIK